MTGDWAVAEHVAAVGPASVRRAVIRADASPTRGGGHVMRCLTLADALQRHGVAVTFAATAESFAVVPSARRFPGCSLVVDDQRATDPSAMADDLGDGWDVIVLDRYDFGAPHCKAARSVADTLVVVDDLADRELDADILVDSTPGREARNYTSLVPETCLRLVGSAFAPLRADFRVARQRRASRVEPERASTVMVSFGLTDPTDATSRALDALAATGSRVTVVLGASAPHRSEVERMTAEAGAVLLIDPQDLAMRLVDTDIVIGAGGISALERCCVGVPSVTVPVADNQRANCAALAAAGATVVADFDELPSLLPGLLADVSRRRALAAAARSLCDGLGARRIATAMAAHAGTRRLRGATLADVEITYRWQCAPETRRYARTPDAPSEAEHRAWFGEKLETDATDLFMIMDGNEAVGVLRLDTLNDPPGREVSIYIAPDRSRRGYARAALELARTLFPTDTLWAFIAAENVASQALFAQAGYCATERAGWYVNAVD